MISDTPELSPVSQQFQTTAVLAAPVQMNCDAKSQECGPEPQSKAQSFRSYLSRLKRVKPFHSVWKLSDHGLTLVELTEISGLNRDLRLSLADRIERIEQPLTAKELARLLNVSRITIFKHAAAGRIPSYRVGTSVRFDPILVAAWLRNQ